MNTTSEETALHDEEPESVEQEQEQDLEQRMHSFEQELTHLINKKCLENGSNTPDFILANYLRRCLETFNACVTRRDGWYGHSSFTDITSPAGADPPALPTGVRPSISINTDQPITLRGHGFKIVYNADGYVLKLVLNYEQLVSEDRSTPNWQLALAVYAIQSDLHRLFIPYSFVTKLQKEGYIDDAQAWLDESSKRLHLDSKLINPNLALKVETN